MFLCLSIHSRETIRTPAQALFGVAFLRKLVILGDLGALFYVCVCDNQDLLDVIFV